MKRVFHPYWNWEDCEAGMWRPITAEERRVLLPKAIEFTGNAELYGSFMRRVVREWPIACEHNLTDDSLNQKAWVGHAAACLAIGAPEDVTRHAWGYLTQEQQDLANRQAELAIHEWNQAYQKQGGQLHIEMD